MRSWAKRQIGVTHVDCSCSTMIGAQVHSIPLGPESPFWRSLRKEPPAAEWEGTLFPKE